MISVSGVSKKFGQVTAVDNVTFEIDRGEIVGLLGPNGAGKTTTMRILTGFLAPDTGRVVIDDVDMSVAPTRGAAKIGYMPENNPLYKDMLASEMLQLACELKGLQGETAHQAVNFVVGAVNIGEVYFRPIGELSKGYKQRVGMAVALLHKPQVLILDEPTEGLDPNQRSELRTLIKKLAREHTILISTHVMQEVEAVCNRLLIINRGKLVADGSVAKLTRMAGGRGSLVADLEGRNIVSELKKHWRDLELVKTNGQRIVVRMPTNSQKELSRLIATNKWTVWKLAEEETQLEDVFRTLTN